MMENQGTGMEDDLGHVISYGNQTQLTEAVLQPAGTQSIPVEGSSVVLGYPDNEEGGATTYIIRFVDGNVASYQQETESQGQLVVEGDTVYQPVEGLVTDPGTSEAIRLAEKVLGEEATVSSDVTVTQQGAALSSHVQVMPEAQQGATVGSHVPVISGAQQSAALRSHAQVVPGAQQGPALSSQGQVSLLSGKLETGVTRKPDTLVAGSVEVIDIGTMVDSSGVDSVSNVDTNTGKTAAHAATVEKKVEPQVGVANTRTRREIKKPPKLKDFVSSDTTRKLSQKSEKLIRLPTLTKTNLDVQDLFIEIEVGQGLFVGSLERTPLKDGSSKYKFRVSKQKFKGSLETECSDTVPESVSIPDQESASKLEKSQDTEHSQKTGGTELSVSAVPVVSISSKSAVSSSVKSSNSSGAKSPVSSGTKSPASGSVKPTVTAKSDVSVNSKANERKSIIRTRSARRLEDLEAKAEKSVKESSTPKRASTRKQTAMAKQTPETVTLSNEKPASRGRNRTKKVLKESEVKSDTVVDQAEETKGTNADNVELSQSEAAESVDATTGGPVKDYTECVELQAALQEFGVLEDATEQAEVKIEAPEPDTEDMDIGEDGADMPEDEVSETALETESAEKEKAEKPKKKRKHDDDSEWEAESTEKEKTKKPRKKRKPKTDEGDVGNEDEKPEVVKKRTYTRRNIYNKTDHNYTVRKTESGKKLYVCGLCGKQCVSEANMLDHMCVHTDERPVPCTHCHLTFKSEKALKRHLIRHQTKTVICDTCGAQFFAQQDLKSHMSVHRNDRLFKCEICHRAFNHSTTLSRHKHTHREDRRQHVCHVCGALFHRMDGVKRHIQNVHADRQESNDNQIQKHDGEVDQALVNDFMPKPSTKKPAAHSELGKKVESSSAEVKVAGNIVLPDAYRQTGFVENKNVSNSVVTPVCSVIPNSAMRPVSSIIPTSAVIPNDTIRTGHDLQIRSVCENAADVEDKCLMGQQFVSNCSVSSHQTPALSNCTGNGSRLGLEAIVPHPSFDHQVFSADHLVSSAGCTGLSAEHRGLPVNRPFLSANRAVLSMDQPVLSTDRPVLSTDRPVVSADFAGASYALQTNNGRLDSYVNTSTAWYPTNSQSLYSSIYYRNPSTN